MAKQIKIYKLVAVLALVVVVTYLPALMNERVIEAFTKEDRIYETLSPIYLIITSMMFAIAFFRAKAQFDWKDPSWIKKMSFLGFALLFFLATMEEISWGQRIFHFQTPATISAENVQKEFTIHNLKIFQTEHGLLEFSRLSAIFTLAFGFLIPVLCLYKPLNRFLAARMPVLPVQLSVLFIFNYLYQKILVRLLLAFPSLYHGTEKAGIPIYEIREHNYEFLLMSSVILYVLLHLDTYAEQESPTPNKINIQKIEKQES